LEWLRNKTSKKNRVNSLAEENYKLDIFILNFRKKAFL